MAFSKDSVCISYQEQKHGESPLQANAAFLGLFLIPAVFLEEDKVEKSEQDEEESISALLGFDDKQEVLTNGLDSAEDYGPGYEVTGACHHDDQEVG